LSGGELGEVPTIENHNPRLLELTRQSKTLNAAIHIQDQEVRAAQREYSMEVAKNIRPKFNELAQRIAPAAKELVDATVEDALLRIAVAIEAGGADNHLPALRFPGIQIAFSEQALDGYLNRLRLAGYEV
jgi:carbonic anhydrase